MTVKIVEGNAEVEAWLKQRKANFLRCMEIPLAQIDERKSRTNQARPTPVVPEAVERYVVALRAGAVFPPIVVYRPGGEGTRFVIVDGNNREASYKRAGRSSIPGYILASDTPTELIELLTVEANSKHGESISAEWRVRQAAHLVSLGWSLEQASRAAGVRPAMVTQHQQIAKADQRAREMSIRGWRDLTASNKHLLSRLKDDPIFRAAARCAIDTGMVADDVKILVRDVQKLVSEDDRLKFIGGVHEQREVERQAKKVLGKQASRVTSPKHSLVTALGKIMHVDEAELMLSIRTELEKKELQRRLNQAQDHILEIQIAIEEALKEESEAV